MEKKVAIELFVLQIIMLLLELGMIGIWLVGTLIMTSAILYTIGAIFSIIMALVIIGISLVGNIIMIKKHIECFKKEDNILSIISIMLGAGVLLSSMVFGLLIGITGIGYFIVSLLGV